MRKLDKTREMFKINLELLFNIFSYDELTLEEKAFKKNFLTRVLMGIQEFISYFEIKQFKIESP